MMSLPVSRLCTSREGGTEGGGVSGFTLSGQELRNGLCWLILSDRPSKLHVGVGGAALVLCSENVLCLSASIWLVIELQLFSSHPQGSEVDHGKLTTVSPLFK